MRLIVQGQAYQDALSQSSALPKKTAALGIESRLTHSKVKSIKAVLPSFNQHRLSRQPLRPKLIGSLKFKSFSESSMTPKGLEQAHTANPQYLSSKERLHQTQQIRQALNALVSEADNFKEINPLSFTKKLTSITESLTAIMDSWSKDPNDFLTRHLLDYDVSLCVKLNHQIERQARLQDSSVLLDLNRNLAAAQERWRHIRYSYNSTLANLEPWLQQSSSITHQRNKMALRPILIRTSTNKPAQPLRKTSLGQLIDIKQPLGEYLLLGHKDFIARKGQKALDQLHFELNRLGIHSLILNTADKQSRVSSTGLDNQRHLGSHTEFLFSKLLCLGSKDFREQFKCPDGSNKNNQKILHYLAEEVCHLFPEQLRVSHYNTISQAKPNDPKLKALIDSLRFVSQHPAYQEVQHAIDSLSLSRGLSPALRGNTESLIQQGVTAVKAITNNRQSTLSKKWKQLLERSLHKPNRDINTLDTLANMSSKQYHRHQKVRHLFDSAHSVHNHRLMRDIQQQHRSDLTADFIKEKAKLGRGLQPNQTNNTADVTQETGINGTNISIAPEAFGFTEAIAGLRSCIHKIKKSRNDLNKLKQQKSTRVQARQALQDFSRRPLTEQIEQLPSFYSNILQAHRSKLDAKGLYSMTVDLCDAWLGATRYSGNLGINALRIGNHVTEAVSGTGFISSSSQALTAASTASSVLALGLSTAKASKNALVLKHQFQTLKHYEQEQQRIASHSELAPLLAYAVQKQHTLTPKVVDLFKEMLSASAYGISSGVGIASAVTAGSAVGLSVASGVGAGAAAVAASAALGTFTYHHARLYRKNQRLEQVAQRWPSDPLTTNPLNQRLTKEQQSLLKRLPNVIADLLVQDLKREIPTTTLNQVRGEFLDLFNRFPKENPNCNTAADAKIQAQAWIERIKMADSSLLKQMEHSAAAQCLRQLGIEPSVIFGIALSTDSEEQDELSRQLILQYAGIPIIKGKVLRFDQLDQDLPAQLKNSP